MTDLSGIDPTEVPLGMYDQPSNQFTVRVADSMMVRPFNGRYVVTVPQHDAHVRSDIYEFSSVDTMIMWIKRFDARLREKR